VALEAVAGTGGANSGEARRSLAGEGLEEGLGVTGVGVLAEARVGAAPEVGRDGDRHCGHGSSGAGELSCCLILPSLLL
jgi:hypothetical protein